MSGLDRFIDFNKGDFRGRGAFLAWRERGFANRLVTMEPHGVAYADARGSEPVFRRDEAVGRTTAGGFGWRIGKLAMVRPDCAAAGTELDVQVLGEIRRAVVIADSPFDPGNSKLRG